MQVGSIAASSEYTGGACASSSDVPSGTFGAVALAQTLATTPFVRHPSTANPGIQDN